MFMIGAGRTANENMFTGRIDEVRLTKAALDPNLFLRAPTGALPCGAWGYLKGDLNQDCRVNMIDMKQYVYDWLFCTDPAYEICW
jgi:hypothetical protein